MIMDEIKPVFDTLYLLRSDTLFNTEIYYRESIKLLEKTDFLSTYILPHILPLIISLIVLYIGYLQYKKYKEDLELRLKPRLTTKIKYKGNKTSIILRNSGTGIGIIKSVDYYYDNNPKPHKSVYLLLTEIIDYIDNKTSDFYEIDKGTDILPYEDIEWIILHVNKNIDFDELQKILGKIKVCIHYENIKGIEEKTYTRRFNEYILQMEQVQEYLKSNNNN